MSTDVYLDVYRDGRPLGDELLGWNHKKWARDFDCARIGHLCVVRDLQFNFVRWLIPLSRACPLVSPVEIRIIVKMMRFLIATLAEVKAKDPVRVASLYGFAPDWKPPYEDVNDPEKIEGLLQDYLGWQWSVRID